MPQCIFSTLYHVIYKKHHVHISNSNDYMSNKNNSKTTIDLGKWIPSNIGIVSVCFKIVNKYYDFWEIIRLTYFKEV